MAKSPYQKERDALFKRIKRYNRSHGTNFKAEFPTYSELKNAGLSESDIDKIADAMRDVRGIKLAKQFTTGGPFTATSEHRISSDEGAIYIKTDKGVGAKIGDIRYINKGEQPYYINEDSGQVIPNKTLYFASKFGINIEEDYLTNTAINDRASGIVDPNITDDVYKKQIKETEEEYPPTPPTYNVEPDSASSISDYNWDDDWGYDDDEEDNDLETYGEANNKSPDYHDYEDDEDDEDDIESDYGYALAEQAYKDASDIIDRYNNNKFIVTNAGGHQGYYVNSEDTKRKLHDILEESYNEATNDNDTAYNWGLEMERNLGNLQEAVEAGTDAYSDQDYQTSLANIAYILNGSFPLDIDAAMELGSAIDLGEDYEEGW